MSLQTVPIIVMTGKESVDDKLKAFELGAVDYVNKPFQVADFEARILSQLRHKRSRDNAEAAQLLEQKRTHEELSRISKAVDSTSDAVCLLDGAGCSHYVNCAFQQLFQTTLNSVQQPGSVARLFRKPESWPLIWNSCKAGTPWSGEIEVLTANEQGVMTLCRADPVSGIDGSTGGVVMIFTDISQRKPLESELLFLANCDPLTGLFNRRYFDEHLETAVLEAKRGSRSYLLYLDLDNFKVVNDCVGHAAGDRLLIEISRILVKNTREGDKVAPFWW